MATRRTVLVGSLPGADAEQAMSAALNAVGGSLTAITDGETGDRSRWLAHLIETFRDHPDLEVAKDGDQSDYQHMLNHRVRRGHRLDPASFDLGYLAAYRESRPVFDRLRDARRPDLSFQVGIGGDFDLALFAMGPLGALRHRGVFAAATAREITQIQRDSNGDVLFQVEIPAETLFTARSGPLAPLVARRMAAGVHRLAAVTPAGTRYALHLCVGDLGHKAMSTPRSTAPLVTLANALARRWPTARWNACTCRWPPATSPPPMTRASTRPSGTSACRRRSGWRPASSTSPAPSTSNGPCWPSSNGPSATPSTLPPPAASAAGIPTRPTPPSPRPPPSPPEGSPGPPATTRSRRRTGLVGRGCRSWRQRRSASPPRTMACRRWR
jgi:hypothetical protein